MKFYVPWSGVELPNILMTDIARDMGITSDHCHTGRRPKLRVAHYSAIGIPHQEYNVRLYPVTDRYRKFSIHGRRINAICWHGHKRFMIRFFDEYPQATIRTALMEYNGYQSFLNRHIYTSDQSWNQNSTCEC